MSNAETIVKFMRASVHSSMLLMGTLIFGDPVLTNYYQLLLKFPRFRIGTIILTQQMSQIYVL